MQKCLAIGARWGHGRGGESGRERKVVALISIVNIFWTLNQFSPNFTTFPKFIGD